MNPTDPIQRLLVIAERERRKRLPASASTPAKRKAKLAPEEDPAWRHQRLQQALVETVRTGREPDQEALEELACSARLGMTEAQALDYLLRKYPAAK